MTPLEFATKWEALHANESLPDWQLVKLNPAKIGDTTIPQASLIFLQEAGLPHSTAPCLTFDDIAEGLKRIYEIFGIAQDWNNEDCERLKPYRVIGSDGAGNPICIDEANQSRVVLLDHEDEFTAIQFVNSSVAQLAECLLLFASGCQSHAALFDANDPDKIRRVKNAAEKLLSEIVRADADAIEGNSFWRVEIQMMQDW